MEIPIKLTAFLSLPLVCLEGIGLQRSVFKENIGEERLNSSKWLEEAEDQSSGEHTHNRVTSDITQTAPALFYSFVIPPFPLPPSDLISSVCFCFANSHGTSPGFIILGFAEHELVFTPDLEHLLLMKMVS